MDPPSHCGRAPVNTARGDEEKLVRDLRGSAATVSSQSAPVWGGVQAQNSWFFGSDGCTGSKRKRVNCGIPNADGFADGCFSSSLISGGGRSVLTSSTSASHLYDTSRHEQRMPHGSPIFGSKSMESYSIGSQGRMELNMETVDPMLNDIGMQLQLGISGSPSAVTTDAHCLSSASFALGQSGTYQEVRDEAFTISKSLPIIDEGSTSARFKAGGYIPSLLMGCRLELLPSLEAEKQKDQSEGENESLFSNHVAETGDGFMSKDIASQSNILMNIRASCGGTASTSVSSPGLGERETCKFRGCKKGARGATGLCIIHGGGRRCQREGCRKGAEGSTVYCKSHGGGRRCQCLGCTKSVEGKTDYCIAHGGGRRCSHDGCAKAARGRSGLCIRHGGGKRCQKEGCTKSAEGYSGLCISHGGGRRCQHEGCKKGSQGSTMFCKAHGGGKRCMIQACNKGAEGSTPLCKGHGGGKRCMFEGGGICTKSVHGGTSFCVAHGGGKRCAVKDCTKSARGKTDFCVRHGGGKRCKVEKCTKSAQGSTDFCKAHGGGKRCCWGQEGSPYSEYVKDKTGDLFKGPCERFSRGKLGLCAAHCALVQDRRVHGASTIGITLLSNIGPGLFRGIVDGSIHGGSHMECTDDAGELAIHGRNGRGDVGAECGRPKLLIRPGRSSEDKEVGKEDNTNGLPSNVKGCTPSWTDRVDGGSVVPSDYGMGLWSGAPLANLASEKSVPASHAGPEISLLPPQVLVPLSMRKVDLISQDKGVPHSSDSSCGGIFNMSSLCLPQSGERDWRVHGANALACLSGRTLSFGTQANK